MSLLAKRKRISKGSLNNKTKRIKYIENVDKDR